MLSWPEFWSRVCHGERLLLTGHGNGLCGLSFWRTGRGILSWLLRDAAFFCGQHFESSRRTKCYEEDKQYKEKDQRSAATSHTGLTITCLRAFAHAIPFMEKAPSHISRWPISLLLLDHCSQITFWVRPPWPHYFKMSPHPSIFYSPFLLYFLSILLITIQYTVSSIYLAYLLFISFH